MALAAASSTDVEALRVLLLPPIDNEHRHRILLETAQDKWHPLSDMPAGREGEEISLSAEKALALQAHGLAVVIPAEAHEIAAPISVTNVIESRVFGDHRLKSLFGLCRRWNLNPRPHRIFSPAAFRQQRFDEFRSALIALRHHPRDRVFDHLWTSEPNESLPLDLKMIGLLAVESDAVACEGIGWLAERRLVTERQAVLRRDALILDLCNSLAQGETICRGFLATDPQRNLVEIPSGWWVDPAMVCDWRAAELRPRDGRAAGGPHYRGLTLAPREPGRVATPTKKNRWTSTELTTWFMERVQGTEASSPWFTEDEDLAAARLRFEGAPRAIIRSLRDSYVAGDRRKRGPRVKSANPPG